MSGPASAPLPPPVGTDATARRDLRFAAYGILIAICCGSMVGWIVRIESASGRTPLLSANDRSRWGAIRAMVDHGTFALDDVVLRRDVPVRNKPAEERGAWPFSDGPPANRDRDWYSIDMVRHCGPDGQEHYYSSKPPLLNILLAGVYWLFKTVTGATLEQQPFFVVRTLLVLLNVIPFGLYLLGIAQLAERHGRSDAGRIFVVGAAAFGTLLTPFASTLNNHLPAAFAALGALYCVDRVRRAETPAGRGWYVAAGLCAALAAVGELPAAALVAAVLVALGLREPLRTAAWVLPPILIVAAASLGANYWAHGSWRPPYAHRHDGRVLWLVESPNHAVSERWIPAADPALREILPAMLAGPGRPDIDQLEWIATEDPHRFVAWNKSRGQRWAVIRTATAIEVHEWDNWYEYEGTYWTDEGKVGVDRGEESRLAYALHVLVGHHGIVSITPIWLLTLVGMMRWVRTGDPWQRWLALGTAAITLVVLAFYLARPLADRNYGGVSCGFRWMLWLVPLWLVCLIPAADWASRSRGARWLAWGLLAVSALSAASSALNPWTHPWLFDWMTEWGWIAY